MPNDRFSTYADSPDAPAAQAFAIVPSDSVELATVTKAIYVGSAGDVTLRPLFAAADDMGSDRRTAIVEACSECAIGAPVDLYGSIGFDTAADLADVVHPKASGNYKVVNGIGGLGGIGARLLGLS